MRLTCSSCGIEAEKQPLSFQPAIIACMNSYSSLILLYYIDYSYLFFNIIFIYYYHYYYYFTAFNGTKVENRFTEENIHQHLYVNSYHQVRFLLFCFVKRISCNDYLFFILK